MIRIVVPLIGFVLLAPLVCQAGEELDRILSFEGPHADGKAHGWVGGPAETLFVDGEIVHGGEWSGRIERDAGSARGFSAFTHSFDIDFSGETLELRGFLRLEDVDEWTGLWLRQDGEGGSVAFDNMQQRRIRGTSDWTEYRVELPLKPEAERVFFGALLAGPGKVWVDDLEILVDGKPVSEAPKRERIETVLDIDQEFDEGSGVTVTELSGTQVANLATLGKVWGFLKYHHPAIDNGKAHWDYELFRVLPKILQAVDRAAANDVLLAWGKELGEVATCDPCAVLPVVGLHLAPELDWIRDRSTLGDDLSGFLWHVYTNRPVGDAKFYVSLYPGVGNPKFDREKGYSALGHHDPGYRILALFRFWNIIRYWFPYRDVMDEDWDAVLTEFLPRFVAAEEVDAYRLELFALIARVHDGHVNLWRLQQMQPPRGSCQVPVILRFVEDRPVVVGYSHDEAGPETGLKVGDVVEALDGQTIDKLTEPWLPYYPASNDTARWRGVVRSLTRGECGSVAIRGSRGDGPFEFTVERMPIADLDFSSGRPHDLPGETFRMLSDEVSYLKLSSVEASKTAEYIERAEGARGLIIDIRNYPSEFVVFALGQHLVAEATPFVRFTHGDLSNPGAFLWRPFPNHLRPSEPRFEGKVVILVDEASMSQAEYTAMAFRVAPGAIVVGSTTAGADGNVSPIPLPGGVQTMISGIGVFYPDKTPTQRVGIVPDIEARPTVAGIRQGRDEVLEEAIRQIVAGDVAEEVIRRMAVGRPVSETVSGPGNDNSK